MIDKFDTANIRINSELANIFAFIFKIIFIKARWAIPLAKERIAQRGNYQ